MKTKYYLFILFLTLSIKALAQKPIELADAKALYDSIYQQSFNQIDELQKINQNGSFLIKAEIINGKITKVLFSNEQPQILMLLFQKALKDYPIKLDIKEEKSTLLIPVSYQYKTAKEATLKESLAQIPSINVDKLTNNPKSEFDIFNSTSDKVIGIPVILLPSIRLSGKLE